MALTPAEFSDAPLPGRVALAVDVLRATTASVAACDAGCRRLVPVPDAEAAEAMAARDGTDTVLAGERGGEALAGFDLGNSPAEFTADRVGGRTVVLTTTNGTAAMLTAARAAAAGLAALTNVTAAARWALEQGRDVTILCAGDNGAFSLEDTVCAGLLVARLTDAVSGRRALRGCPGCARPRSALRRSARPPRGGLGLGPQARSGWAAPPTSPGASART